MSVTVVAQYRVDSENVATVREALRKMVAPSRAEPGCLAYDVYVDPRDDSLVVLVERYVDDSAFQAHLNSGHFDTLVRGTVLPRLSDRVRFDLVPLDDLDDADSARRD